MQTIQKLTKFSMPLTELSYNMVFIALWCRRPVMDNGWNKTAHCPSGHSADVQGWVMTEHFCYKWVHKKTVHQLRSSEQLYFMKAREYCKSIGGSLAAPKYDGEWHWAIYIYMRSKYKVDFFYTMIGMCWGNMSVPNMYRKIAIADDGTVLYHPPTPILAQLRKHMTCVAFTFRFTAFRIDLSSRSWNVLCEFSLKKNLRERIVPIAKQFINAPHLNFLQDQITQCQDGHTTHVFLSCGPNNVCGKHTGSCYFSTKRPISPQDHTKTVDFFLCDDKHLKLSYSFVCDFRPDCPDESDESFCQHPLCDAFTCENGQCVQVHKRCDKIDDCLDDSDEKDCDDYRTKVMVSITFLIAPVLVNFDGVQYFILTKMKVDELCPNTHYRCPGDVNDCLPVYTRCNGMYDCIGHEDEEDCEEATCPGFFRCRSSTVCVDSDHMCDGWPHCPLHDDELLCGMRCPKTCLCHGYVFLCSKPFPAHLFPQLRCLDGKGSKMTLSDLNRNVYLVHVSLAKCALRTLPLVTLDNLQFLDLSDNNVKHADMATFVVLKNLRKLSLARNPLSALRSDRAVNTYHTSLKTLDLSHTKLTMFDSQIISQYLALRTLNLSFTTIHTIGPHGFQLIPFLTKLSMKGSLVKTFQPDIFRGLSHLSSISVQNHKLCCKDILPDHFKGRFCDAPKDEISSCQDLLRTDIYRVFLWLVSSLSVTGNVCCFIVRLTTRKTSMSSYSIFVSNLSVSDLLMGIYITIIGVADAVYRGRYLLNDGKWVSSEICKLAGFLSLLSSEVSAMIIWLISLDRFIVMQFPFGNVRFKMRSASVACTVAWLVGVLLAMLPLLPFAIHWEFYSQTGICVPLPITRLQFKGHLYSVSVFIIFNFVLFLMISACQAFIYWSIKKHSLTSDGTKSSQEITIARRLITVAVTDFVCWFPVGLCGLLALAGVPIPSEINVVFAVFLLPVNSALNPFVYTFNALAEKRRKARETKLFKWLQTQDHMV